MGKEDFFLSFFLFFLLVEPELQCQLRSSSPLHNKLALDLFARMGEKIWGMGYNWSSYVVPVIVDNASHEISPVVRSIYCGGNPAFPSPRSSQTTLLPVFPIFTTTPLERNTPVVARVRAIRLTADARQQHKPPIFSYPSLHPSRALLLPPPFFHLSIFLSSSFYTWLWGKIRMPEKLAMGTK